MAFPDAYCKGCVCKACKKSAINGALFACSFNGCRNCSEDAGFCHLLYCAELVPYENEHTDDLRL